MGVVLAAKTPYAKMLPTIAEIKGKGLSQTATNVKTLIPLYEAFKWNIPAPMVGRIVQAYLTGSTWKNSNPQVFEIEQGPLINDLKRLASPSSGLLASISKSMAPVKK